MKNLTSGTYVLYSKSASGVMGYPGDKTVVASTFDENGNIKLENAEGAAIITVEKQSDGTYILKLGKKYLTAESNRVLSLKDEKTNDTKSDAYWNIEFNASLGGFTIASTNSDIENNIDEDRSAYISSVFGVTKNKDIVFSRIVVFCELNEVLQRILLNHADITEVCEFLNITVLDSKTLALAVLHV